MSLTKWEAGQELIACADRLLEADQELEKAGYHELASALRECRLTIGDHFNAFGSHAFGLPCHRKKK